MERFNFITEDEQAKVLRDYQRRTRATISETIRDAIAAYPPLDPAVSGQRILGIVARTESGFVNLGWRRG